MNQILYRICRNHLLIGPRWIPISSVRLSQICDLSLYQTRKELKRLKREGWILSDMVSYFDEETGNILYRGYDITEKAFSTPEYQQAFKEEQEICKRCLDIDINQYY